MRFDFTPTNYIDREHALKSFGSSVKSYVMSNGLLLKNPRQTVLILVELAKNTYDHSTGIGILDFHLSMQGGSFRIIYKDTGAAFDIDLSSRPGLSSKAGNGINCGLGMSIIQQGAISAGMRLDIERVRDGTVFCFEIVFPII